MKKITETTMFPSMEELADSYRIQGIKQYLTWGWGEKCPEYNSECFVCTVWREFEYYLEHLKVVKKNEVL